MTESSWTVLSAGRRGTLTATDRELAVGFDGETTRFPRAGLELEFPTPYSVRLVEGGQVQLALGFASTAEAQDFRRAMTPPGDPVHDDSTMVMRPAPARRPLGPGELVVRAFVIGVVVQLFGGAVLAAFHDSGEGLGFGLFLIWAGSVPLLGAVVAWGVRTGIEASRRADGR